MKKILPFVLLCLALSVPCVHSEPYSSVKIIPESTDYPTVRTRYYHHSKEKRPNLPHEFSTVFGVRRWLNPTERESVFLEATIERAWGQLDLYGGYGVLGHGEEIFTSEAKQVRDQSCREQKASKR